MTPGVNLKSQELRQQIRELETRLRACATELQQSHAALQVEVQARGAAEESLRQISGWLLELQGEERRRIARDLHDSTSQLLAAINLNVDRAHELARSCRDERIEDLLLDTGHLLQELMLEVTTLTYLLHPPMLGELGLQHALSRYIEGFGRRSGISVELAILPDLGRLSRESELALFRIVQEALTNIQRHSGSRAARVTLIRDSDNVTLEITDQGCGMPPGLGTAGAEGIDRLGVGIAGMRERAHQLGGELELSSLPGGTTIRVVLPRTAPSPADADNSASTAA